MATRGRKGWRGRAGTGAMALLAGAALLASAGCDPCAGTASCEGEPRVSLSGQIVDALGHGVSGTRVSVLVGGDSVVTSTSSDGFWHVEHAATGTGSERVDVVVETAGESSYRVNGVEVPLVTRGGDAHLLDRWLYAPYFPAQVELYYRGTTDTRASKAEVTFRRTGGVALLPGADTVTRATTDAGGRATVLSPSQVAAAFGEIIGDLTVKLPGDLGTSVITGVRIQNSYKYKDATQIVRYAVGPNLDYAIRVFNRATAAPQPNTRVTFTRTGGVATSPTTVTGVTDATGTWLLRLRPLAQGEVVGTLVLAPPAPARPDTLRNVRIATFDDNAGRLFANLNVGPYFNYYGFVRANGRGLAGVQVTVRRTGGINITPATYTFTTGPEGIVFLNPVPLAVGEVILEIQFRPPAPYTAFTVKNLRLTTLEKDFPQGVHVWGWDLDLGPSGPPGTQVTTP